jgi:hypothetical protein
VAFLLDEQYRHLTISNTCRCRDLITGRMIKCLTYTTAAEETICRRVALDLATSREERDASRYV